MTLADLNGLWPADAKAMPWVATPDGSWTRLVGDGVNPDIAPSKEARRNAPADRSSAPPSFGIWTARRFSRRSPDAATRVAARC
jgi:hypothetical protein